MPADATAAGLMFAALIFIKFEPKMITKTTSRRSALGEMIALTGDTTRNAGNVTAAAVGKVIASTTGGGKHHSLHGN